MSTRSPGHHWCIDRISLLSHWWSSHRHHHFFGSHSFQPGAPDVATWPVSAIRTGQQTVDSGDTRTDVEGSAWLEEIGQNTALTRRGFFVSMLSRQEARSRQERQSPMRAAYNKR